MGHLKIKFTVPLKLVFFQIVERLFSGGEKQHYQYLHWTQESLEKMQQLKKKKEKRCEYSQSVVYFLEQSFSPPPPSFFFLS